MIPSELPRRARNLGIASTPLPIGELSPQDVLNIGREARDTERVGAIMNFNPDPRHVALQDFMTETHASLFRML